MLRPSTVVDDSKILKLYGENIRPKEIRVRLKLQNVFCVYNAIRRSKTIYKILLKNKLAQK